MDETPENILHDETVQGRIEKYALSLFCEESGEVAQAAGQALRFGIDSPSSNGSARQKLETELGDVLAAIRYAVARGVLSMAPIETQAQKKLLLLLDPRSKDNLGRRLAP